MKEKGLLAYYNVFLVFLLSLSVMINYFEQVLKEKNNTLYQYELIQMNYIDNYSSLIILSLNQLNEVPKYVRILDHSCEITTIDKDTSVYSFITRYSSFVPFHSPYYNCKVTFKFIKGNCKIIKMEVEAVE